MSEPPAPQRFAPIAHRRLLLIEVAHYGETGRMASDVSHYGARAPRPHGAPDKPSSPPDRSNADENARLAYLAPPPSTQRGRSTNALKQLLRVHNDPAPYAKRLARRLLDATPERIASITREPSELRHRIDPEPYAEIATLVSEHAARAKRPTDTS